jgi:hypothetical protein
MIYEHEFETRDYPGLRIEVWKYGKKADASEVMDLLRLEVNRKEELSMKVDILMILRKKRLKELKKQFKDPLEMKWLKKELINIKK